jgi:hypothetical protein
MLSISGLSINSTWPAILRIRGKPPREWHCPRGSGATLKIISLVGISDVLQNTYYPTFRAADCQWSSYFSLRYWKGCRTGLRLRLCRRRSKPLRIRSGHRNGREYSGRSSRSLFPSPFRLWIHQCLDTSTIPPAPSGPFS